jgi:transcriptional regulator with XRE-family HTH domain
VARWESDFDPEALRRLRASASSTRGAGQGMSAQELARAVGTTKTQILAYEAGSRVPQPPRIRELAAALHVHPIDLSRVGRDAFTSLSGLRRASGLCTREMVEQLGVAPRTYRRFESQGLVPIQRPEFMAAVSKVLGLSEGTVEQALSRTPQVVERVNRLNAALEAMRKAYVEIPKDWDPPRAEHAAVIAASALVMRGPTGMARLLEEIFEGFRLRLLQIHVLRIRGTYEVDSADRQSARLLSITSRRRYSRDWQSLGSDLDFFFRRALPSEGWQAMVKLQAQAQDNWIPQDDLDIPVGALGSLPDEFLLRRLREGAKDEVSLSEAGRIHFRTYGAWYRALFPGAGTAGGGPAPTNRTGQ